MSSNNWLQDSNWLTLYEWLEESEPRVGVGFQVRFNITQKKPVGFQFLRVNRFANAKGVQFRRVIFNEENFGFQIQRKITPRDPIALQFERFIQAQNIVGIEFHRVLTQVVSTGIQFHRVLTKLFDVGFQFERFITTTNNVGIEFHRVLTKTKNVGIETERFITTKNDVGIQTERFITTKNDVGIEFHRVLTKDKNVGIEFKRFITTKNIIATQFERFITTKNNVGIEFHRVLTKIKPVGFQFNIVSRPAIGFQFRAVFYNTTRLRILKDFPSRGTTGQNWTASSTRAGDFSVNNLNTDIVEQAWSSDFTTSAVLTCDTEVAQGVFVDTLGILNHNLTLGAVILFEGSNDSDFSTVPFSVRIDNEITNSYWVSPKLPVDRLRYWRFVITDLGNPEGFIRIGTIVFGSAVIFSEQECFTDFVQFGLTQFSDAIQTEGFTYVKNDRGRKRNLNLSFESLDFNGINFRALRTIFETTGTIMKILWIPIPERPSRFALFGKLSQIPVEEHNAKGLDADYVSLKITVNEAE